MTAAEIRLRAKIEDGNANEVERALYIALCSLDRIADGFEEEGGSARVDAKRNHSRAVALLEGAPR